MLTVSLLRWTLTFFVHIFWLCG